MPLRACLGRPRLRDWTAGQPSQLRVPLQSLDKLLPIDRTKFPFLSFVLFIGEDRGAVRGPGNYRGAGAAQSRNIRRGRALTRVRGGSARGALKVLQAKVSTESSATQELPGAPRSVSQKAGKCVNEKGKPRLVCFWKFLFQAPSTQGQFQVWSPAD